MQRTLSEHINYLEQEIESLKIELQEPGKSPSTRKEVRIDLGIAERALVHFRKAFEFEQRVSQRVRS